MPLYEYECEGCGRRFEVIRKFSDPPLERCDACGATVRKLLSSPAIQFKGSGFYINDYARKSGDSSGSKESAPPKDSAAGSSSEKAPASASTSTSSSSSSSSTAPTKDS